MSAEAFCKSANAAYLVEGMGLDLREFVLHVIRIHRPDLISSRRPQNLDDFHQLIDTGFTGEKWLAEHKFRHNASGGPHICRSVRSSQELEICSDVPILVV